jgi:hypothetical protein
MVHSTGANNPNLKRYVGPDDGQLGVNTSNHWNREKPDGRLICPHAFIGRLADGTVATYQTLPWDMRGWHGGSGPKGSVNDTHIGFEICEDGLKDEKYLGLVYKEAAELCAHLCGLLGLDPLGDGVIIGHYEGYQRGVATNHADPRHWFSKHGKSMDAFRADVKKLMDAGTAPDTAEDAPKADAKPAATPAAKPAVKPATKPAAKPAKDAPAAPASPAGAAAEADAVIWEFLKSKGLNDYAVAGIMGNLFAESALSPVNLQNTFEKKLGMSDTAYTQAVDEGSYTNFARDSAGYGLAQWTFWSRKEALLKFAKEQGKSIGDAEMQTAYLWKELQGYTGLMADLKAASSVRAASDAVLLKFEKPADQGEPVRVRRASYGQKYYDKFAGTVAASPVSAAPASPASLPAAAAAFAPYAARVTGDKVNVRKGPGTSFAVVGSIADRGVYTVTEEADGPGATKWGKLKEKAGWISLDYAKKE